jgi:hypothetical protein
MECAKAAAFTLAIFTFAVTTAQCAMPTNMIAPDLVVLHATIHTMAKNSPRAEALAVWGNRIAAVGPSSAIRELVRSSTRVIDAQERLLVPGFNDAHVHFLSGGASLTNVNLRDCRSPEAMAQRLAAFAAKLPRGRWIQGGDWDHENWPGAPLPTRQLIDASTPEHPVLVSRLDGHMALANSLALKLAGVTAQTQDPPGGLIVRDPKSGEPTGILKDAAADLVSKVIPPMSREEKVEAARAATEHAASLGVTSVTDVSADDDVGIYQELLEHGELKTRVYGARPIPSWERLKNVRAAFGSPMLRIGALKGFSDGSLGSTTALFFEPYADAPSTSGLLFEQMYPEGIMLERTRAADLQGLQVMIHAIGDRANALILDVYEQTLRANGPRDRRFRIEHAQHLTKADIQRFADLKVVASMQPYHAADDGRWCEKRIGPERSKTTYAFRSLLDAGALLAFGSDWTVAPLNPLLGIQAAVTRQTLDAKHPGGWIPEQKISVHEAVHAFTVGSAYAEFAEKEKGTIEPGRLADFVLLSKDIFSIPPEEIATAKPILTVMDGRVVYDASGQ